MKKIIMLLFAVSLFTSPAVNAEDDKVLQEQLSIGTQGLQSSALKNSEDEKPVKKTKKTKTKKNKKTKNQ
jgi:hypothetical protein